MSIENTAQAPELDASTYQCDFAEELGLDYTDCKDESELILLIERELGQKSMLELARWFLLSVLQHIQNMQWNELADSGLDSAQQYALATEFIGHDEYKQSLLTVLKSSRFRFTLVSFAKSRNPQRRVLSTSTKAYRQAREILLRHELVDQQAVSRKGRRPAKKKVVPTAVSRRAARRGVVDDMPERPTLEPVQVEEAAAVSDEGMSEEEFAELDAVLANSSGDEGKPWTYQNNDERLSLMFGVLAGGGVFALALWLFL